MNIKKSKMKPYKNEQLNLFEKKIQECYKNMCNNRTNTFGTLLPYEKYLNIQKCYEIDIKKLTEHRKRSERLSIVSIEDRIRKIVLEDEISRRLKKKGIEYSELELNRKKYYLRMFREQTFPIKRHIDKSLIKKENNIIDTEEIIDNLILTFKTFSFKECLNLNLKIPIEHKESNFPTREIFITCVSNEFVRYVVENYYEHSLKIICNLPSILNNRKVKKEINWYYSILKFKILCQNRQKNLIF